MLVSAVFVAAVLLTGAPSPDTTITARGLVAAGQDSAGGSTGAGLVLSEPLVIGGEQVWILRLRGTGSWADWDGRYVEATGTLGPKSADGWPLTAVRLRDVKPRSAARREVTSPSHRSEVTLAVVPRRFTASATTSAQPITPFIYFEVLVQGQTDLIFEASNNELVCASVTAPDQRNAAWRDATRLPGKEGTPLAIRIGPVLRVRIPIPGPVVSQPGVYTVRATLCGNPDFDLKTSLEVGRP